MTHNLNRDKPNLFKQIWNDKVGSKLIAATIIGVITQIPIIILSLTKKQSFYEVYQWVYNEYLLNISTTNIILIVLLALAISSIIYLFSIMKRNNGFDSQIVDNTLVYKREKYFADREYVIRNNELFSDTKIRINVKSISEKPVTNINHRIIVNKRQEGDLKNNQEFKFLGGTRKLNGQVDHQVLDISNNIMVWNVRFTPGLKFNETAEYSYSRTLKVEQGTWEQLQKSLRDKNSIPFNHWEIKTVTQTNELIINVKFPPNYPITFYEEGLYVVKNETELELERNRIIQEGGYKARIDPKTQLWKMSIVVKNPGLGVSYGIAWVPPQISEIQGISK